MGKTLKIITSIAVLTILYIWLSMTINSCGTKSNSPLDEITENVDELVEDTGEVIGEATEDLFEDEEAGEDAGESIEEDITFEEAEEIIEEKIMDTPKPTYTPSTSANTSSTGVYMIIAGSYLIESNASEMVTKLKGMGYNSAEKVVFDNSPYHTVITSRFDDYAQAVKVSNNLKSKGVDCYVKKRS